nr:YegS/Rv2252/BmrU family lipid kinase [uncultured Cetobacterium sp.]
MSKRAKLIYNPISGGGKILKNLDKIFSIYQEFGYIVDVFRITNNYNEEEEREKILFEIEKYDHILISGGDGTINSFVNFLKKKDIEIPIGILPTGTANDFANVLGIPKNIEDACRQILQSKAQYIDLGKINDEYFVNIASAGIFSNISQTTDRHMIKKIGKLAYVLNGIKEMSKIKKMKVILESKEYSQILSLVSILIFNGKSAGSFELAYKSDVDDGYLDVLILKPDFITDVPEMTAALAKKDYLEREFHSFKYFKTKSLKIIGNEKYSTDVDGERGPELPVTITCIPKGLKVLGIL